MIYPVHDVLLCFNVELGQKFAYYRCSFVGFLHVEFDKGGIGKDVFARVESSMV